MQGTEEQDQEAVSMEGKSTVAAKPMSPWGSCSLWSAMWWMEARPPQADVAGLPVKEGVTAGC